jgi:hypothetical protein
VLFEQWTIEYAKSQVDLDLNDERQREQHRDNKNRSLPSKDKREESWRCCSLILLRCPKRGKGGGERGEE